MYLKSLLLSTILLLVCSVATAPAAQQEGIEWAWGGSPVYMVRTADNFLILYDRSKSMGDRFMDTDRKSVV